MNKTAIRNFAIEARKKLISEITYRAGLVGITKNGNVDPIHKADGIEMYNIGASDPYTIKGEQLKQRKSLASRVQEKGIDNVIEEVAYTWFNRIIAVRFMEINDYLPTRVRVLSSETPGKVEPDIVTEAPNVDLGFDSIEIEEILQLKHDNKLDELFRRLFIKQCNALNELLPELFEKTSDYTELLLSISFTNEDSIVRLLINSVKEENFKEQVEIIGWLYQYYNTELKDDTFAKLKANIKITKERIPAATQLFTPNWIVRYMVENSLGRLWLEGHPDSDIKAKWKYILDESEQEPDVEVQLEKHRADRKNIKPEEIKVLDPCMGSGHILVYAFEVLMDIYKSCGYEEREAAKLILQNNLYGLDIDDRAYQFAYFAVMMKARKFNRRILTEEIRPNLCSIKESNAIRSDLVDFIANGNTAMKSDLQYIVDTFYDAKEYGSILIVKQVDFEKIYTRISEIEQEYYRDIFEIVKRDEVIARLYPIIKQAEIMAREYEIVATNPPYMGKKSLNNKISDFMDCNYPDGKSELYSAFILKCYDFAKLNGFISMVTIHTWMFISSFEKLREFIIKHTTISSMLHTGASTFEELNSFNVLATTFCLKKAIFNDYCTLFVRLADYYNSEEKIINYKNENNYYTIKQNKFRVIPGIPYAYWVSENARKVFEYNKTIKYYYEPKQGMATADNNRFVRNWAEINIEKFNNTADSLKSAANSRAKWFPYNKGGNFRKWYGMNEYVLNWENGGMELKNYKSAVLRNEKFYFKSGITWSLFGFENFGVRYKDAGFLFDVSGSSIFPSDDNELYVLAFLASKVAFMYLSILAPTVNFQVGNIGDLPLIISKEYKAEIEVLANENINISREDWDDFEESWDFTMHPLFKYSSSKKLVSIFDDWACYAEKRNSKLKHNEERINGIFIEIYNLQDDLNPNVVDRDIALRKADLGRDLRSFISYAVGCMLGRYSLDVEGLAYAGGEIHQCTKYNVKCTMATENGQCRTETSFCPDHDNIIPITDTEYFADDIVGRFVEFVKVTFGVDTLEENLDFIAKALGNKGNTSREVIRQYFNKDFYKDHVKIYQKKPIYWMFDSGKENGFKALIYMHRYYQDTVGRVRADYLHKTQKAIESATSRADVVIDSAANPSQKAKAVKDKTKLVKQLAETKVYDAAIGHIAAQRIAIDLDDGITVNYAKFQGVEVSREGKKANKINLLGKI